MLMVEDTWYWSLDSDGGAQKWAGRRGQAMLTSAFSPMIILTTELMHAGLRLVSKITFVDNILRLMIDEDWRGRKPPLGQRNSCMYACIKEKLEPMFGQWLLRPTRLLSLLFFCTIKSFVNSCSGPLDLFYSLSLSWISLSVYISINLLQKALKFYIKNRITALKRKM